MTTMTATPETPATVKKDARPPAAKTALPGKRGNFVNVPLADLTIIEDKAHPLYDPRVEEPLSPEFAANVKEEGVHQPVFVAKLKIDGALRNVVIDGKQRLRAAREGGLKTIPAIAVKGDTHALFSLMILTNENRRDDTPLAKAQKVARFVELYGHGAESLVPEVLKEAKVQAALIFGVTQKTIDGRLRLLQTAPAVQKAVEQGRIGWWAASEFAGLPVEEQEKAVEEVIVEAGKGGKKPGVEDAKRKAGKGDAKKREKLAALKADLLDAAEAFGSAAEDQEGIREATERLKDAARAFYKVVSAPAKKEPAKGGAKGA
jgi:ParB family chromosome partitioning protein